MFKVDCELCEKVFGESPASMVEPIEKRAQAEALVRIHARLYSAHEATIKEVHNGTG